MESQDVENGFDVIMISSRIVKLSSPTRSQLALKTNPKPQTLSLFLSRCDFLSIGPRYVSGIQVKCSKRALLQYLSPTPGIPTPSPQHPPQLFFFFYGLKTCLKYFGGSLLQL